MSTRKFTLLSLPKLTLFYLPLIVIASVAVGMVIASRLDLAPASSAQTIAVPPMNSAPLTGPLTADTFRNIAKAQAPMVVNIRTEMKAKAQDLEDLFGGGGGGAPDDFLRRFFGGPGGGQGPAAPGGDDNGQGNGNRRRQREPVQRATGTGFIISKDGLILTNNHVVEDAIKIDVLLYADDETTYSAKVIGHDPLTDSALIQLIDKPSTPLPEAKFGDSSQMAPGDWVMAIGNPFSLAHTVSVGVISATKRPFQVTDGRSNEMLQTDAAINPGNSGGPLLNIRGEVIGINTAIISNGRSEGNIGIGFAVPINTVRDLLPQLREGKVIRGRIGVTVSPVPREGYEDFGLKSRTGAVVGSVLPGGAAQKGGIEPGDVITEYNGRPVPNRDELVKMVIATKPGTSVPVKVLRNKQERTLHVTVDQLDLDAEQQTQRSTRSEAAPWTRDATGRRIRPDARERDAANRPAPAAAVRPIRSAGHRGGSRRSGCRTAACRRHHPVDQPQAGDQRRRGGARAASGGIGPHRANPHLARRQPGVRDGQEGIATDLLTRIRERGPLTVAAFMDLALYDPEAGYYARAAQRSGRAGDFFTSVDVGPVFGELLEIQLAEMADILSPAMPVPPDLPDLPGFDLVEAAAGNGRLAADILTAATRRDPAFYSRIRLHLIETSPAARAAQRPVLGAVAERLASSSPDVPASFSGVLLANELLDALPVHQVVMRREGLREIYVDASHGALRTIEGPASTPELEAYFERLGIELEPGARAEVNLRACEWIRTAARRLTRGFIIVIDYGHEARELYSPTHAGGTLTTFARHTAAGPELPADAPAWLEEAGDRDITSHVDFTSVRMAAEAEGLTTVGFLDQTYFLIGLGAANLDVSDLKKRLALKTLLMPGGLGSTHKVLIFGKGVGQPALAGCSYRMRVT